MAFASAALLAVLSFGGIVWLAPVLIPAAILLAWMRGTGTALAAAGMFVVATAVLSIPTLLQADAFFEPAKGTLTSDSELGNLVEPLSRLQLAGIWPAGDFRFDPGSLALTYLLIGVLVVAASITVAEAWRRQAWALLLYLAAAVGGALAISTWGSPWVGAKALASGSPAILLAGAAGAAVLIARGRRVPGGILALLIAGGVVWSNVLAYHEVNLAPRERHAELEQIGDQIAGKGPTLMTEYEPYGVRHLLREGDPEGASELRRRPVLLRSGRQLAKLEVADIDEISLDALLVYRTLVLRRSPAASRPPSIYSKVRSGRYYDVWQRPPGSESTLLDHMPLGYGALAAAPADCDSVQQLAGLARTQGGQMAYAPRPRPLRVPMTAYDGSDWQSDGAEPGAVIPGGPGRGTGVLRVPASGTYDIFVRGSFRGRLQLSVDGRRVASERHLLSHSGQYEPLGAVTLARGRHQVEFDYSTGVLHPGSGGPAPSLGPLFFARRSAGAVRRVAPSAGTVAVRSAARLGRSRHALEVLRARRTTRAGRKPGPRCSAS